MNWSKLDPNHVIYALSFVWAVGGWLWNKARGEKQQSFRETITGVIDSIVLEMFANEITTDEQALTVNVQGYLASSRARAEKHAWTVLAKRGVPRNKLTERVVHEAIERASAMVARELVERRTAARNRKAAT